MILKLIKLSETRFAILTNDQKTTGKGNLKQAIKALMSQGIPFEEIELALLDMSVKGTNVCEFGINATFMYSEFVSLQEEQGAA